MRRHRAGAGEPLRLGVGAAASLPGGSLILVTGASGFLGSHLCAALAARGLRVRGLVRTAPGQPIAGVEFIAAGELPGASGLASALDGVDAVVHLAARVHRLRDTAADPRAEYRRVNVEGTRALLAASLAAGIRTFVFASSVKAMGEANEAPWTENTVPAPVDPYGESKLEAERLVADRAAEGGLRAVILRFPLIYGPRVGGNLLRLLDLVDSGVPLPFGGIDNRRSLLFSGNAVSAIETVLESPAAEGTFLVSDGHDLSTPDLIRGMAAALDRPARVINVPRSVLRLGAGAASVLGRATGRGAVGGSLSRLTGSLTVDPRRLIETTGWHPPFTVEQGLRATAGWYRARDQELRVA